MMTKRIFIDANIVIDLLNDKNKMNEEIIGLFNKLLANEDILLCSPVTFAIVYYFLGKQIKNRKLLNEKMRRLFLPFTFTKEDANIMNNVLQSPFQDLEDAIQYYSALDAKAEIIITKNFFDFYISVIPVFHPTEYVQEFF